MVFARGGDTLRVPLVPVPDVFEPDHLSTGISVTTPRQVPMVIDSIVLRGRLAVEVLGGASTLPLKLNAAMVHDGRRTAIYYLAPLLRRSTSGTENHLVDDGTDPVNSSSFGERKVTRVKLVNEVRHESIPLVASHNGGSSRMIILPGVMLHESSDTYKAAPLDRFNLGHSVDSAWLRGAHLELSQWVPKGSYRVHDTFVVR